jgi:excisionase family DNA binding protein
MKPELLSPSPPVITPLSVRPKEAARALGISERLLWSWTQNHQIPHVRVGGVVLYPVEELQRWLRGQTTCIAAGQSGNESADSTVDAAGR